MSILFYLISRSQTINSISLFVGAKLESRKYSANKIHIFTPTSQLTFVHIWTWYHRHLFNSISFWWCVNSIDRQLISDLNLKRTLKIVLKISNRFSNKSKQNEVSHMQSRTPMKTEYYTRIQEYNQIICLLPIFGDAHSRIPYSTNWLKVTDYVYCVKVRGTIKTF